MCLPWRGTCVHEGFVCVSACIFHEIFYKYLWSVHNLICRNMMWWYCVVYNFYRYYRLFASDKFPPTENNENKWRVKLWVWSTYRSNTESCMNSEVIRHYCWYHFTGSFLSNSHSHPRSESSKRILFYLNIYSTRHRNGDDKIWQCFM